MEHTSNNLGDIIKNARQKSKLTIEDLAAKVGITERFLYRIENEGNKPSFAVLFRLIRELSISPDLIFYPEMARSNPDIEALMHMLYQCDKRDLAVVKATVQALHDNSHNK